MEVGSSLMAESEDEQNDIMSVVKESKYYRGYCSRLQFLEGHNPEILALYIYPTCHEVKSLDFAFSFVIAH